MNWKVLTQYPDSETEAQWNEFLQNASFATHYVTPNFFVDPYIRGGERFAVLALDNGKISGVISAVDSARVITSGMAVRPQTAFRQGADLVQTTSALLTGLREKGGADLELIKLYTWEPIHEFTKLGFKEEIASPDDAIITLDLSIGADEIFKGFSQTRRNELRKAIKQNLLEIKDLETEEEFKELYAIHVDWNNRKGNLPDSEADWRLAMAQKEHRKVIIAKYEGKVVAGSYYRFCKGSVVEYAANNSLIEFQKLRPNDLIGWRSIEWACQQGFKIYSMGGSHLFLRRFGGNEVCSYYYHLDSTFLHIHDLKEKIGRFGVKTYRGLPQSVKNKIKKIAGKD